MIDASTFAGRSFVVRTDRSWAAGGTFADDLRFLCDRGIRPIVVAPSRADARDHVRALNRFADLAVGLSGADGALLPAGGGHVGRVRTRILATLTAAGYVPVVEPVALDLSGADVDVSADDVAAAIASATEAVRALFFTSAGGIVDPATAVPIGELTPAEALALADGDDLSEELRAVVRAAARGVRAGVGAAQILDGRIAHATIVELLTSQHLGTQVAGTVWVA